MDKIKNKSTETILLAHGSGGKLMHRLIDDLFRHEFDNEILNELSDSAVINDIGAENELCFTTDSYVVKPLFFPGADIGKISICGTINDLAVAGARPRYISCGFIIEEGLGYDILKRIVISMARVAANEGVKIVTGDLKVVERGAADKVFINTSGVGIKPKMIKLSRYKIRPTDRIIINGSIAQHGLAVIAAREQLQFKTELKSDCASLNSLIQQILKATSNIRFMRDPTRGGLATTLNEIVSGMSFGVELDESSIPINQAVLSVCELLGFDPLYVPNEGKVVLVVSKRDVQKVLDIMHKHPRGRSARVIGQITKEYKGKVILKTKIGGSRIVDMLVADQLPRIC
jgi:hydrogenase expression/formation protein HypE